MAIAVRVRAKVTGHRRAGMADHELSLALLPGRVSAQRLIEAAVTAEVAALEQRADEAQFVRLLTERSLTEELNRGAVRLGEREPAAPVQGGQEWPHTQHSASSTSQG